MYDKTRHNCDKKTFNLFHKNVGINKGWVSRSQADIIWPQIHAVFGKWPSNEVHVLEATPKM